MSYVTLIIPTALICSTHHSHIYVWFLVKMYFNVIFFWFFLVFLQPRSGFPIDRMYMQRGYLLLKCRDYPWLLNTTAMAQAGVWFWNWLLICTMDLMGQPDVKVEVLIWICPISANPSTRANRAPPTNRRAKKGQTNRQVIRKMDKRNRGK